jgi:hypothetical protein
MKIKVPAILAFCLFTITAFAQNGYSIKGSAIDTSSKVKLENTTVCVLNAKDSILRKFTYAGENGIFSINGLSSGKFILLMSYKDYADYVEPFTLDPTHNTIDFGKIIMRLKSRILKEVMIKGQVTAIKIKGDTTEFNAKAYVIQPNDKVEDLLKQLPGMQVDKDGKITANGQAVNKVLVDGEEFFGDDPTLVTKNIRADMVYKVQLYDKKSDQAAFTGIDDGVKTKTINIKLKEDKKSGTFGKITGGVGTDDYYEGQAIYNRFKAHQKYSAYATLANDGKTGLGFGDSNNLGTSGGNVQIGDDGSISIFISGNDALDSFNGTYDGKGLPLARSGGVHYDGKWNSDKESINSNYKVGSVEVNGNTSTVSQQTLAGRVINTNSNQTFDNYAFRQKLDAAYTIKLDTATTLKVSADGTLKNFTVNNGYNSSAESGTGSLINQQIRNVKNNGDQQIYDVSALYTKKFKKPRRTFSWNISEAYNNSVTKGNLYSKTDFYNAAGLKDSTNLVDQYKTTNTISSALNSNMTYTEPLSKYLSLVFNYGLGINNNTQDSKSFNQSAPGIYNTLDTNYSNNYKFNQLTNQVGAIFNFKKNKITFNFGTKASDVNFKQIDENTGIVYRRDFINWAPQANFQYRASQQSGFSINYNGNTTQPTINQIQPVKVNTDPQNITVGNAALKPSFSNSIFFNYNSYKVLSGQSIYLYGYVNFTSNTIVNRTVTDTSTAKSITQYVNLNNKTPYNYYTSASISRQIKPVDINVGISLNVNGNVSYSYSNGLINMSRSDTYSGSLQISKYVAKKYSLSVRGGPDYTLNEFSLQSAGNNNAAGFNINGSVTYYLPAKFIISSDLRYNYTAKTQAFDAQYKDIWNASLSKTFLKDDKLRFSLSANDLLNQNTNYSRRISGNTITQSNTNGIKRYFMFSVAWDFTKFGTTAAAKN